MKRWKLTGTVLAGLLLSACPKEDETKLGNTSGDPQSSSSTGVQEPPCGTIADTFPNETCAACAESSCCTELKACDDNPVCGELLTCRASCFDQPCVDACNTQYAGGAGELGALQQCLDGPCAADCPPPTGLCGSNVTIGDAACGDCIEMNCCPPLTDCLSDANCEMCITTGDGTDCANDLYYTSARECFQQFCAAACPEG